MSEDIRRRIDEARLALMLLTRIPAGRLGEPAPTLGQSQWAFPMVGLVVGAILWAAMHLALWAGLGPLPSAALALGVTALVTGGLHHDGLADFADGMGGGRDRDHALEIMRDSRIGSYGTLALIFAMVLGISAMADISSRLTLGSALLVAVFSRLMMLGVLISLPAARPDGLGKSAVDGSSPASCIAGAILSLLLVLMVGSAGFAIIATAAPVAVAVALIAYRRIGGQTGDVLGATQLACEIAGWLALSVALSR